MKNFIILSLIPVFVMFLSTLLSAQPFNQAQDLGYYSNSFWDVAVDSPYIIGFGRAQELIEGTNIKREGTIVAKHTLDGTLLNHVLFTDTVTIDSINSNFYISWWYGQILPTSDGGYLFTSNSQFKYHSDNERVCLTLRDGKSSKQRIIELL